MNRIYKISQFKCSWVTWALTLTALCCIQMSAFAVPKGKTPVPFLEVSIGRDKVTEGERLMYEVTLLTPVMDIAGIEIATPPDFKSLTFKQTSGDSGIGEVERGGVKYYTAIIDRYFVGFNNKGKYRIKGGEYRLGINHRIKVNDTFWGPTYRNELEVMNLSAPDVSVTVETLPEAGRPADYSGAVGSFSVTARAVQKEMRAGRDGVLIVSVAGNGDLNDAAIPDIRKAFPADLVLKSMTETRDYFVQDGKLGSEIEIECVFSPRKTGTFTIGGIEFKYYNSETHRYETAVSPDVEIEVSNPPDKNTRPTEKLDI